MNTREPVQRSHFIAQAEPREVYEILVDFPSYPRLFGELKSARLLSASPPVFRVEFRAHLVLPVRYVLDLTCEPDGPSIKWSYVEGEVVTGSAGGWRFTVENGGTRVDYQAAIDINAPLPGFLLRKVTDGLVSASLPRMFTSIEAEVNKRRSTGR